MAGTRLGMTNFKLQGNASREDERTHASQSRINAVAAGAACT
jgi:hypothetical protein